MKKSIALALYALIPAVAASHAAGFDVSSLPQDQQNIVLQANNARAYACDPSHGNPPTVLMADCGEIVKHIGDETSGQSEIVPDQMWSWSLSPSPDKMRDDVACEVEYIRSIYNRGAQRPTLVTSPFAEFKAILNLCQVQNDPSIDAAKARIWNTSAPGGPIEMNPNREDFGFWLVTWTNDLRGAMFQRIKSTLPADVQAEVWPPASPNN
jgi:hypothetical protein